MADGLAVAVACRRPAQSSNQERFALRLVSLATGHEPHTLPIDGPTGRLDQGTSQLWQPHSLGRDPALRSTRHGVICALAWLDS